MYTYINIYIWIFLVRKNGETKTQLNQGTRLGISIEVRADDELVAFEVQQNVEVPGGVARKILEKRVFYGIPKLVEKIEKNRVMVG